MEVQKVVRGLLILNILCYVRDVTSYPGGAPNSACDGMEPTHGSTESTLALPYSLTLSKNTYSPGDEITFTLSATSGSFKGYLLQVRKSDESIGGSFVAPSDGQTICTNGRTHTERSSKTSQTFTWKAPDTTAGELKVLLTIVQEKTTYWVKKNVATITEALPTTTEGAAATTTTIATVENTTIAATDGSTTAATDNSSTTATPENPTSTPVKTTAVSTEDNKSTGASTTAASSAKTTSTGQPGSKDTQVKSEGLKSVDIVIIVVTCVVVGLLLIGILVMCIHIRINKTHERDERKYRLRDEPNLERTADFDKTDVVSSGTGTASTINYQEWMDEVKTEL